MLDPLWQAVEQAWNAGIVVVVAAGRAGRDNTLNTDGYGTIEIPGNDPYVISRTERSPKVAYRPHCTAGLRYP